MSTTNPTGRRPNFLFLMVDEMRHPPVYESEATRAFRAAHLHIQPVLRQNGVNFTRHYAASVACAPSRTSMFTGQYPSLHGVTQTTGAAKSASDPQTFWLDPNGVPTMGAWFRAGGYRTFWHGKWHVSDADLATPGTHNGLPSYTADGAPDPQKVALYRAANRLDPYGFDGWIGPEPHGSNPLNSGSSAKDARGRDVAYRDEVVATLKALDAAEDDTPWLMVASFVNPHDITLYGLAARLGGGFSFPVGEDVPKDLFDDSFKASRFEDLSTKPSAQASYAASYRQWMQPIVDKEFYERLYYQLQQTVDTDLMAVYETLMQTRFAEDTIVIFTSDHGDLLDAHGHMHQKWYTMYEEALHVPFIISNPKLFPGGAEVDGLTSHVDLLPTMLGLAGLDADQLLTSIAPRYTDAMPLIGRDLTPALVNRTPLTDPIYFMTDDDPSRGPNQVNFTGIAYNSVIQPNHIEAVIVAGEDGTLWKYARYFDNPQFWSTPGRPGNPNVNVEDIVISPVGTPPDTDGTTQWPYNYTVKHQPLAEEYEMYELGADPLELNNLAGQPQWAERQAQLAALLAEQSAAKRTIPQSGRVPGQPLPIPAGQMG
ncbi:sulfatase-like hydrolase/transferase [uncultured Tistrella sp.]|uniref:sulfatase-like hydrolase/transferase n=1 Tax=Tistrella mobilis TaxID=171437 RepID=UPI000C0B038A|nr:sulfatase-like hydrolase/transferase [uncultured Tistrella sp.]MAM75028.1 arylsulfatase [Tistrella sp.]